MGEWLLEFVQSGKKKKKEEEEEEEEAKPLTKGLSKK